MSRQVDVKALVSHIVRGDGGDKCRICMGDTTEGQVFLGDTVMLDGNKPVTLAELLETITGVEVSSDGDMPDALCMTCAVSAKEAGTFRIFCQGAVNQWTTTLLLMESFPSHQHLPDDNKSIYFVMTNDAVTIINDLDDNDYDNDYESNDKFIKSEDVQPGDDNLQQDDVIPDPDDSDDVTDIEHSTEPQEQASKREYSTDIAKMTCPDCGQTFKYARLMLRHFEQLADPRRACFICNKEMSRENLIKHFINFHYIQCYPCSKCPAIFQSRKQFLNHTKKAHKPGSHDCLDCGRTFQSLSGLNAHIGVHKPKNCPSCDKLFRNQVCYRYHVKHCCDLQKTKTKVKFVINAQSDKVVKVGLRGATPKTDQDCYCDYCKKRYTSKNSLAMHIRVTHLRETLIPCTYCKKEFSKYHMKKHLRTHEQRETFTCGQCGYVLQSKDGYQCHLRLHTVERLYTCKFCGKKFTTSSNHSTHVKVAHKNPLILSRHVCKLCQADFTMSRGLKRHMVREHPKEVVIKKPEYKCDICTRSFYTNHGLKIHKTKSHQPKKPEYKCDICFRSFYTNHGLKNHMTEPHQPIQSRRKKKPEYKCDICLRSFYTNHGLKNHKTKSHQPIQSRGKK